jgi:hypothetical protein
VQWLFGTCSHLKWPSGLTIKPVGWRIARAAPPRKIPAPVDFAVPVIYAGGLLAVVVGAGLALGGLSAAASLTIVSGVFILTLASLAQCQADCASRRAPPAHPTEPHNLHHDEDTAPALDAPATTLALLGTAVILASAALAVAFAFGARLWPSLAPLLFLIGAVVVLGATTLHLAAELQRGADVALIARAVRAGGSGATRRAVCAAAALHEAAAPTRLSALRTAVCGRPPVPLAELRQGLSPLIFSALAINLCGAVLLVVSSALQLGGGGEEVFVVLICSFSLFILGVLLVLFVGVHRVAAHRRGGRAHLEYDVGRALEGWA